jgi:hypothetical protein
MGRSLNLLLVVWALVAMPAVCLSGWMICPCACGEPGCDGGHESCPDGHGCPDDPCSVQALRVGDQDDVPGADALPTAAFADLVLRVPCEADLTPAADGALPLLSSVTPTGLVPGVTPLLL